MIMGDATAIEHPPLVAEYPGAAPDGPALKYELVKRLGEGGFGWVWLARQAHPVRREVAVKILKPQRRMDAARSRFLMESRVLARLRHPGIAVMHEAGMTTEGSCCLVMELVDGLPVTEHGDALRLSLRERVDLVARVADAVSHAHQMLVMHRDLKPSNILVPRVPAAGGSMPKVIDFGVAKLLDAEAFDRTCWTFTGEVIGTYDYMSPEQAEADPEAITVTADVYSLGAVLHEMLLGAPPRALLRLQQKGRSQIPQMPGRDDPIVVPRDCLRSMADESRQTLAQLRGCTVTELRQVLGGDLGAVLMKACANDPAARYESMTAFASDLRAWLDDRPVTALPPTRAYVLRKYVRRHRAAVAGVALAALGLALAGAIILRYAEKARAAEQTAVAQKNQAEQSRRQAEKAARTAQDALGEAEASSRLLLNALNSPFPTQKGRDVTVLQVLDQAARELRADSTLPLKRRSSLLHTLGSIFYAHSRYKAAADVLDESVRIRRLMHGMAHTSTLWESMLLARCWIHTGQRPRALAMAESCLAVIPGLKHPDAPNLETTARDLKISCLYYLKDHERAARFARECVAISRARHGDEAPDTLRFLDELAANLPYIGKQQEAAEILEAILPKIRVKMAANDSKAAIVACRLAALQIDRRMPEKALPLAEEAVAFARRVYAPSHGQTAFFTRTKIRAMIALGRSEQAVSTMNQWLDAVNVPELKKDEHELLSREAFQMLSILPEGGGFQSVRARLGTLMQAGANAPAVVDTRSAVEFGLQARPAVERCLDLESGMIAGIGLGHLEADVKNGLPSASWRRTAAADLPGCECLRSSDHPGLEFTFREDGVLCRIRMDLTVSHVRLAQDLSDDPKSAASYLGEKYNEEIVPGLQQLVTFHASGLEWRLKRDLVAGKLVVVSLTAPYWQSGKP